MQSCLPTFVRWCTLLGVFFVFPATCAQAVAANQRLDKTALYPDALGGLSSYTDLTNVMPGQDFTLTRLSQGAEQNCYAPGGADECANVKSTWSVYNATYSDNPSKKVYVCICQGSPVTAQSLASNYSQVPLYLRQWVASVSSVPASQGHAYTSASHITFFGALGFDVLVHESTHAQDQGFSGSNAYLQAIGSDTCVPDDYAQTNNVECYAQDMVVFLYKLWRPYDQPLGTTCMANQLKALNSSQAPGLQAYITSTVAATVPNACTINCFHTVVQGDTLDNIASGLKQTPQSLIPYNSQIGNSTVLYPGERICLPAQLCKISRRLLRA